VGSSGTVLGLDEQPASTKGQCNAARSTVDVEPFAARYFYDQVLINQPMDLSFGGDTDRVSAAWVKLRGDQCDTLSRFISLHGGVAAGLL
jgi:hypothetical protein